MPAKSVAASYRDATPLAKRNLDSSHDALAE